MYIPNDYITYKGMTGAAKYYRGESGAMQLHNDLALAKIEGFRLILTLGRVSPSLYLGSNGDVV